MTTCPEKSATATAAAEGQRHALITAEQRASLREFGRQHSPALFRLLTSKNRPSGSVPPSHNKASPELASGADGKLSPENAIPAGPYRLGSCDTSGADAYGWELVGREVHMANASRVMRRAGNRDLEACQPSDEPGVLSVWYPDPHDPAGRWQDYPLSRSIGFKD